MSESSCEHSRFDRSIPGRRLVLGFAAIVAFASCGGDGTTTPTPPPPPPPPPLPVTPVQVGTIPNQTIATGQTQTLDVASYFNDPDGGALTYTAASSDAGVVSVSTSGSTLTLVGVTATDSDGLTATQNAAVTVKASDRDILRILYETTGGPNWERSRNWLTDAPVGEWSGVLVNDDGAVVGLHLRGNELTGPIPPELGQLSALTYLSLSDNELTGPIPPELGLLSALESLFLGTSISVWNGNDLTGPMPPELGQLSALTSLDLSDNELTGSIPPELGQLSALESLFLSGNELTGPIPPELGQLSALTYLFLSGNELTGPIPPELGQLSALWALRISSNALTDEFPSSFASLSNVDWAQWQSNAGLCAPRTSAFDTWLAGMNYWQGPRCGNADEDHAETATHSARLRDAATRLAARATTADQGADGNVLLLANLKALKALGEQLDHPARNPR